MFLFPTFSPKRPKDKGGPTTFGGKTGKVRCEEKRKGKIYNDSHMSRLTIVYVFIVIEGPLLNDDTQYPVTVLRVRAVRVTKSFWRRKSLVEVLLTS